MKPTIKSSIAIVRYCAALALSLSVVACAYTPARSSPSASPSNALNQTSIGNPNTVAGTASTPSDPQNTIGPEDPFENLNRVIFTFNDAFDRAAFKPLAKTYNFIVPKGIRNSVTNFFANIADVYTMANNFLQGQFTAGSQDLMRISINSVFGVLGLFDVASQAGLPKHHQDFGQTLGHYGVVPGPYVVLPFLGPSTVRDTVGFLMDRTADPTTYINDIALRNEIFALRFLSTRASLLEITSLINRVSLDRYISVRNAYLQRRNYLIHGNTQELPDYGDEEGHTQSEDPLHAAYRTEKNVPPVHMLPPGTFPALHIH